MSSGKGYSTCKETLADYFIAQWQYGSCPSFIKCDTTIFAGYAVRKRCTACEPTPPRTMNYASYYDLSDCSDVPDYYLGARSSDSCIGTTHWWYQIDCDRRMMRLYTLTTGYCDVDAGGVLRRQVKFNDGECTCDGEGSYFKAYCQRINYDYITTYTGKSANLCPSSDKEWADWTVPVLTFEAVVARDNCDTTAGCTGGDTYTLCGKTHKKYTFPLNMNMIYAYTTECLGLPDYVGGTTESWNCFDTQSKHTDADSGKEVGVYLLLKCPQFDLGEDVEDNYVAVCYDDDSCLSGCQTRINDTELSCTGDLTTDGGYLRYVCLGEDVDNSGFAGFVSAYLVALLALFMIL